MNSNQKQSFTITKNAYLTDSEYLIDTILVIGLPKFTEPNITQNQIVSKLKILNIIHRDSSSPFIRSIGTLEDVVDRVQIAVSRAYLKSPDESYSTCYFTFQQKDPSHQSNTARYTIFYYTYFYKYIQKKNSNATAIFFPRTICIISQFSCPGFFRELCMTITSDGIIDNEIPLELLLTTLIYYLPPPMKSQKLEILLHPYKKNTKGKEIINSNNKSHEKGCILNGVNVIPTFDFVLTGIFNVIDVQKFAKLYMLLFIPVDICIFSEKDEILNILGNTLLAITYPFIFDSVLSEYTIDEFFERYMPPNSVEIEKRIHLIHGGYNKARDKDRLKQIFPFVAIYDLDASDFFYILSDSKKENEEDKKIKKKIFEQVGNNKNKQILIGPFINKLEESLMNLSEKSILNSKMENEIEDNYIWKINDHFSTNIQFQNVCYFVNIWLLTLLLYHERQKAKDPKGQSSHQIYSFAFREKELCKGEKEYFIAFVEYFKCFIKNLRKYFTSLEDDKYKSLLQLNTNEKLTLIITEEISHLYTIYFNIQKQQKSSFSFKDKDIEELSLSTLKEIIAEEEEKDKDKEKNQVVNPYLNHNGCSTIDIYSMAESFYLVNKTELDKYTKNKQEFLEPNLIKKCIEIINKDKTKNDFKLHESNSPESFYGQIPFQNISLMIEKNILSISSFKSQLTDYLHLTLLIILSMFVHESVRYEELLETIGKYHKLFLRRYLSIILEQYHKGKKKHPEDQMIKQGISIISTFINNENIPKNEILKLYSLLPNKVPQTNMKVKSKQKETKQKSDSKQKTEPFAIFVGGGAKKLELRENYCKDNIFEEDYVAKCYDNCRTKVMTFINCNGCGFQIKPKIYLKFLDKNNNDEQSKNKQSTNKQTPNGSNKKPPCKRIKCLVEPIQIIYEKSLAMIGDTNIKEEDIMHILVNLLFYYWNKVRDKVIILFIFDTIKNVEYKIELPNRYQL